MKILLFIFCCLLVSTAWCQDNSLLISWNKLASAFVMRATIFENTTLSVSRIIQIDSSTIKDITERKVALKTLLDLSDRLDSNFIRQVAEENKKSIASFSKVMNLMLSEPTFASKKEFSDFQMQLMTVENQIFSAKKQYNALGLTKDRKDLLYP